MYYSSAELSATPICTEVSSCYYLPFLLIRFIISGLRGDCITLIRVYEPVLFLLPKDFFTPADCVPLKLLGLNPLPLPSEEESLSMERFVSITMLFDDMSALLSGLYFVSSRLWSLAAEVLVAGAKLDFLLIIN